MSTNEKVITEKHNSLKIIFEYQGRLKVDVTMQCYMS